MAASASAPRVSGVASTAQAPARAPKAPHRPAGAPATDPDLPQPWQRPERGPTDQRRRLANRPATHPDFAAHAHPSPAPPDSPSKTPAPPGQGRSAKASSTIKHAPRLNPPDSTGTPCTCAVAAAITPRSRFSDWCNPVRLSAVGASTARAAYQQPPARGAKHRPPPAWKGDGSRHLSSLRAIDRAHAQRRK